MVLLLFFATLVAACSRPRPVSQIIVYVEAQPLTRAEATHLTIVVRGGPPGTTPIDARELGYDAPLAWPYDVTVVPAANDASRILEVEATAYDGGRRIVARATLRAGYAQGEGRTVHLLLEDACRGVVCPPEQTCRSGRCSAVVEVGDAGVPSDGGMDGGTGCTSSGACDDHNACNGAERCEGGACLPGERLDCDDHVGCTDDSCDGRVCVHTPDRTVCTAAAGGTCDPINDCQYDTCDGATCVPTGCQHAICSGTTCRRTFACGIGQTCCGTLCVASGCDDENPCHYFHSQE